MNRRQKTILALLVAVTLASIVLKHQLKRDPYVRPLHVQEVQ
jgi:hypothetical protein